VLSECRIKAQEIIKQGKPVNKTAAVIIVLIWISLAGLAVFYGYRLIKQ
jgi:hypothetical protein